MKTAAVRSVEFLVAYEDQTWDTVVVNVPIDVGTDREALTTWAESNITREAHLRDAVMVAVYHVPDVEDDEQCRKCGSPVDAHDHCTDETCPLSDREQSASYTEG